MGKPLVFQTNFGYYDGAVTAMYSVAYSVAINQRSFAKAYDIGTGQEWSIILQKVAK